jgi:hypothetical protein
MSMTIREMYFSVDMEADGRAPGLSSMLSIGVVAIDPITLEFCGDFYATLQRLPEAQPDNDTMNFWDKHPKQWVEARENPQDPGEAMMNLQAWVRAKQVEIGAIHGSEKPDKPPYAVFVANPAGFDFTWVYYYLHRFVGESCFGFSALDMTTFAATLLGVPFTAKDKMLPEWESVFPHTHNALEDARSQGDTFRKMLKWRQMRMFYDLRTEIARPYSAPAELIASDGSVIING